MLFERFQVPVGGRMAGLDGYELLERLGTGSSGTVWRARERGGTGRTVAIKRLAAADEPTRREALREEAAILAALDHPHVVDILACLDDAHGLAIVMPYAAGGSLERRLRGGPLPWPEVVELGISLADALASAHRHGVLHRDVAPGNVLLTADGEPLLADFGVARAAGVHGTPGYVDPAVLRGAAPDARSDVYGLARLLEHALTGQPPAPHGQDAASGGRDGSAAQATALETSGAPATLAAALAAATAVETAERPLDATAFAEALRACRPAEGRGRRRTDATPSQAGTRATTSAASTAGGVSATPGPTHHGPGGDGGVGEAPSAPPLVRRARSGGSEAAAPAATVDFTAAPTPPEPEPSVAVPWRWVVVAALGLLLVPPLLAWGLRQAWEGPPSGVQATAPAVAVEAAPAQHAAVGAPGPALHRTDLRDGHRRHSTVASTARSATASPAARTRWAPPPSNAGVKTRSTVPVASTRTCTSPPPGATPTAASTASRA